jgi:SAM-dependent methyltransferase
MNIDGTLDQPFWDGMYAASDGDWSGEPNGTLVAETAHLAPGDALDAGTGEGMDAIRLATRGWRVLANDISAVAIERDRALALPPAVAECIDWQHADLREWVPAPRSFDLVVSQFLQLEKAVREPIFRTLAEAVRPGGTLVIVGHDPSDLAIPEINRPQRPEMFFSAADVAALLDPTAWEIVTAEARPRRSPHHTEPITIHDAVMRATRR